MEVIVIFDINKNLDGIYKLYNEGKIDLAIKLDILNSNECKKLLNNAKEESI